MTSLTSRLTALAVVAFSLALGTRCAADDKKAAEPQIATISAEALHARLQAAEKKPLLVDVREPGEYDEVHIQDAMLAPLGSVAQGVAEVPKDREIVLVCRSGRRSGKAQELLTARGYTRLQNMEGGMLAWERNGYPVVKP